MFAAELNVAQWFSYFVKLVVVTQKKDQYSNLTTLANRKRNKQTIISTLLSIKQILIKLEYFFYSPALNHLDFQEMTRIHCVYL